MSMVHTLVVHQNLLGVFQNIDAWVSPLSPHKSEICWGQAQASLFTNPGNSLVVSWLGLYTSTAATAGNMGSVPGWETRILLAAWYSKKERKEKKKYSLCFQKHSTPRSRVGFGHHTSLESVLFLWFQSCDLERNVQPLWMAISQSIKWEGTFWLVKMSDKPNAIKLAEHGTQNRRSLNHHNPESWCCSWVHAPCSSTPRSQNKQVKCE